MDLEKAKKILDRITGGEFSFYADFVNETIQQLNLGKGSRILDIGTGGGIMAIILALNGFDVSTGEPEEVDHGHDHEHQHVEFHNDWRGSAKAVGVENKIKYHNLDSEDLPFPDCSFDAIFMLDTLQHINNRELALKECMRVSKPRGVVCIFEMNENGVEYCRSKYGFVPDLVDPRDFVSNDIAVEVLTGKLVNAYVLRKN